MDFVIILKASVSTSAEDVVGFECLSVSKFFRICREDSIGSLSPRLLIG